MISFTIISRKHCQEYLNGIEYPPPEDTPPEEEPEEPILSDQMIAYQGEWSTSSLFKNILG